MGSARYPENQSPLRAELVERCERFATLREDFLVGYSYNTARAYWGDLEHLNDWCMDEGIDILALGSDDFARYLAWMESLGYSRSTVRRRATALRAFNAAIASIRVETAVTVEGR